MMANYIGVDGSVRNDELKHWKYIKKIKSGSGWRYFYTPEEVRSYYKEEQGKADKQYKKDIKDAKEQRAFSKQMNDNYRRNGLGTRKEVNRQADKNDRITNHHYANDKLRAKIKKNVTPVTGTAKAVIEKPTRVPKNATKKAIRDTQSKAKRDINDTKYYYKMQQEKANKQYSREVSSAKRDAKQARAVNDATLKAGKKKAAKSQYSTSESLKAERRHKAAERVIKTVTSARTTYSAIKRSGQPKVNTGKAIVNRTLKSEVKAEKKRRKVRKVQSTSQNAVQNIAKSLGNSTRKSETRKNRSGSKSYKMYNRW